MDDDNRPRTIRDGLVPLGPGDTYNGVKVSSFCDECRDALARYEHGMQASVTLCRVDSARVAENAPSDPVMVPILPLNGGPLAPSMEPPLRVDGWQTIAIKRRTPEHPAPWTWGIAGYPEQINGKPATLALYDANGTEIVGTDGDDWSWVSCDSARVRALIAAAPEMEALLRELFAATEDGKYVDDVRPLRARVRVLLARIDEARRG